MGGWVSVGKAALGKLNVRSNVGFHIVPAILSIPILPLFFQRVKRKRVIQVKVYQFRRDCGR